MDSKRVQETKGKIRDAFLELYKQKRMEKISIKEITDKAGINRGTFYVYYTDIYDLKEKVEAEAIERIREHAIPVVRGLIRSQKIDMKLLPKEFFYEEQSILELFFGESAEINSVNKLKKIMQDTVTEMFGLKKDVVDWEKSSLKYALEYVSAAQLGVIGYWFRHKMELPMEELGKRLEEINLTGCITYMIKELKVQEDREKKPV
ncbi:TetR/AcrR family transcriptional regulator [Aminipila luticellarii]|nr:TetR/AcrR family transcriptional regulator [Aminipila luticellarii]